MTNNNVNNKSFVYNRQIRFNSVRFPIWAYSKRCKSAWNCLFLGRTMIFISDIFTLDERPHKNIYYLAWTLSRVCTYICMRVCMLFFSSVIWWHCFYNSHFTTIGWKGNQFILSPTNIKILLFHTFHTKLWKQGFFFVRFKLRILCFSFRFLPCLFLAAILPVAGPQMQRRQRQHSASPVRLRGKVRVQELGGNSNIYGRSSSHLLTGQISSLY